MGLLDPILFSQISTLLDPARLTAHSYRGDVQAKLLARNRPDGRRLIRHSQMSKLQDKVALSFFLRPHIAAVCLQLCQVFCIDPSLLSLDLGTGYGNLRTHANLSTLTILFERLL